MVANGLVITVAGMAIVFVFLVLLVLAMKGLYAFVKKFLPASLVPTSEERQQVQTASAQSAGGPTQAAPGDVVAAIAAAKTYIMNYRG